MPKPARAPAAAPKPWYEIQALADNEAEVLIYGDIGDSWNGDSITAATLVKELQAIKADVIHVRINSYGGAVSDGLAIYNALKRHDATIEVWIDGMALSIASLIAMAGDTVRMASNALVMVHAPWGGAFGNSAELRAYADVLDKHAQAMSTSYASKTGKSSEDCLALLTDGDDHWYESDEARDFGFVDEIYDAAQPDESAAHARAIYAQARFDLSRFKHLPAAAAALLPQELVMPKETVDPKAAPVVVPAVATVTAPPAADRTAILADDAKRRGEIRQAFAAFKDRPGIQALLDTCLDNSDMSVDGARGQLLAKLGDGAAPLNAGAPRVEMGEQNDADTRRTGLVEALLHRTAPAKNKLSERARSYRGMNLREMARAVCEANGIRTQGLTPGEIATKAMHSTSDFPFVLENVISKTLRQAYEGTSRTFLPFCRQATLPDFKQVSRVQLGGAPSLKRVLEGAEYEQGTINEGAEKYSVQKYGRKVALTWETIVNDDLDAFTRVPAMFGRSAADLESDIVYGILTANASLSDNVALFHNTHSNLGAAAAISDVSISAGRTAMLKQKGLEGRHIVVRPEFLIVPAALLTTAEKQVALPILPNKTADANPFYGRLQPIAEPRLDDVSATAWYLAATPDQIDTIEYAYLDGYEGVFTEVMEGRDVDGLIVKCRHVFGAKAIDFRGLFKNPGA